MIVVSEPNGPDICRLGVLPEVVSLSMGNLEHQCHLLKAVLWRRCLLESLPMG